MLPLRSDGRVLVVDLTGPGMPAAGSNPTGSARIGRVPWLADEETGASLRWPMEPPARRSHSAGSFRQDAWAASKPIRIEEALALALRMNQHPACWATAQDELARLLASMKVCRWSMSLNEGPERFHHPQEASSPAERDIRTHAARCRKTPARATRAAAARPTAAQFKLRFRGGCGGREKAEGSQRDLRFVWEKPIGPVQDTSYMHAGCGETSKGSTCSPPTGCGRGSTARRGPTPFPP